MFHKALKSKWTNQYSLNGYKCYTNNYRRVLKYNPHNNNPFNYKNNQEQDLYIIHSVCNKIFGAVNEAWVYESEHRTYIADFLSLRLIYKQANDPAQQECYFDHVVYYKDVPFIIESDDPSHYDKNYCLKKGWDYEDIVARDLLKDYWCEQMGYKLIRLRADWSIQQRFDYLIKIFTLYKPLIDSNI